MNLREKVEELLRGGFSTSHRVKVYELIDAAERDAQRAEAAERKLTNLITALQPFAVAFKEAEDEANRISSLGGYIPLDNEELDIVIDAFPCRITVGDIKLAADALAQIEQPQDAPTNHISVHPSAPTEEIQELRIIAADWQLQFHALRAQCGTNGFTVRYGEDGMPVLEAPNQYLPGEDPPFDACQCRDCLAARVELRKEESK